MNLRSLSIVLVLCLLLAFAAPSWTAFTAPTRLSLLFTSVGAPLGLVLPTATGALAALLLLFEVEDRLERGER